MKQRFIISVTVALCALLAAWTLFPSPVAARMDSEVTCEPTDMPLVYDCTIKLTDRKTGQPIENAKFMMHTSMPSMPMAHHMAPVEGKPGNAPGVYHGTFHFGMAGEWAIDIRTTAPSRDLMRHTIKVHKKGASSEHKKPMKHPKP